MFVATLAFPFCAASGEDSGQPLEFRIFDVSTLLIPVKDQHSPDSLFAGRKVDLREGESVFSADERKSDAFLAYDRLVAMINDEVTGDGAEEPAEGSFVKLIEGRVFARETAANLDKIRRLIAGLEDEALKSLSMEVVVFGSGTPESVFEAAGVKSVLDPRTAADVLGKAAALGAKPSRWHVSAMNRQKVLVCEGAEDSVLSGYESSQESPQFSVLPDPTVSTVFTGVFISLTPVINPIDSSVVLTLNYASTAGEHSSFETRDTPAGRIQTPSLFFSSIATTTVIPDGAWLILRVPARSRDSGEKPDARAEAGGSESTIMIRAVKVGIPGKAEAEKGK